MNFPGRTESDLYLWIVEHLYFLREIEQDTSLEDAADDYAEQYSEKSIKKLVRGFKQAFADNDEDAAGNCEGRAGARSIHGRDAAGRTAA